MKWLNSIVVTFATSLFLTGCIAGTDTDEVDDEEQTQEAASPLVLYGNFCDEGVCITYKFECNANNECTYTILEIKEQQVPLDP